MRHGQLLEAQVAAHEAVGHNPQAINGDNEREGDDDRHQRLAATEEIGQRPGKHDDQDVDQHTADDDDDEGVLTNFLNVVACLYHDLTHAHVGE